MDVGSPMRRLNDLQSSLSWARLRAFCQLRPVLLILDSILFALGRPFHRMSSTYLEFDCRSFEVHVPTNGSDFRASVWRLFVADLVVPGLVYQLNSSDLPQSRHLEHIENAIFALLASSITKSWFRRLSTSMTRSLWADFMVFSAHLIRIRMTKVLSPNSEMYDPNIWSANSSQSAIWSMQLREFINGKSPIIKTSIRPVWIAYSCEDNIWK